VTQCYSAAATNGTSDVGGLIGDNNGTVTQCYSSAVTNGTSDVGGLIGHNNVGTVTQCYSMGVVSGDSGVGGLVGGSDEDTIIQCFWDTQTSGQVTSAGGIGLTTAEMQMESTFFAWGACEGAGVWSINEGHDYPRLSWENKTGQSIQSSLSDFLEGHGTQDDPYLIYTVADVNTIAVFPCEQDKCFRLMFLDGAGTQDDPYLICTADQLDLMGTCPYERQAHFKLTADIDLDPNLPGRKIFDKAVISNFFGVFDGNGHKISHLTIVGTDYLGLFGRLGEWRPYEEVDVVGEVKNLGTVDVNINGVGNNIGGLVGENYGTIEQCHSTGEVSGDWSVGGLVGSNEGSITACYSTGTVSGNGSYCDGGIGGLVGTNFRQITNCYSTSTVHGNYYAGGLIGVNDGRGFGQADWGVSFHRFVAECYSSGIVNGAEVVGGLVGANGLEIANCYSTSIVVGNQYVGGLVGQNWSSYPLVTDIEVSGIIVRCYSTGAVSGNSNVGGLVGGNSYFILGQGNQGTVTNCVWDIETSGQQGSADGVGLKTNEMMDSYMPDMNGFANDPNWVLGDGRDYPRLAWESTMEQIIPESEINWLEGQGTTEDPYIIDTADQLIRLGKAIILWDKNLVLGADIDLDPNLPGRQVFTQAPIKVFSGIFDGNGHTISHLNIKGWDGWDYLGLFGQLQRGAELRNLGVIDVNIVGSGSYIGGLVGYNSASIANCYSKGTFTGGYDVGGLLGRNIGSIANSYSIGTISGSYVGGLVGSNGGSVSNCYSSGMVTGYWYVCGLVGVGNLDKVAQSFWDIQTSGLTVSFGGTGKTTAQMQTASTFLDAGWDFVDETENGTEDIWWINEGQDYPRLWWEAE
jgi:hypothetical protein